MFSKTSLRDPTREQKNVFLISLLSSVNELIYLFEKKKVAELLQVLLPVSEKWNTD